MPRYPIYIISKGRADVCKTSKALDRMKVPHNVVVEPQEYRLYKSYISNNNKIIQLPFSNLGKGSIPARNFVWDHSKQSGHDKHWILDDNIQNFYRLNHTKRIICNSPSIFKACEDFVDRYDNVPMAGMNYTTFAMPSKRIKLFTLNTRVYSCILLENKHSIRWRGRYNEDTDLSLRFLKLGYCTILFNAFLIDKQHTMTMKGGNADIYDKTNNRYEFAKSLYDQHPDVVKIVKKWGRYHHQVDYKSFNNKLRKKDSSIKYDKINDYGMVKRKLNV